MVLRKQKSTLKGKIQYNLFLHKSGKKQKRNLLKLHVHICELFL